MSRLTIRPRRVDIHKKLQIFKSVKEFENDKNISRSNSQLLHLSQEVRRTRKEFLPTPEFVTVDTYERDYTPTFAQPTCYLRGRGARAEIGEFVEYDLDNEDDDWLQEFNSERKILTAEKFESFLFKLEVLDHKTRERAGVKIPLGSPVPAILQQIAAIELLQSESIKYAVCRSVYDYWKAKRDRLQKPILRRLQPPPPENDANPYTAFRSREKTHRMHTRRMQRREANVQSFEKLRQVRDNLDQAKTLLEALIKREEKKRDIMQGEVSLQKIQIKYKIFEDGLPFMDYPSNSFSSDKSIECEPRTQPTAAENPQYMDPKMMEIPAGRDDRQTPPSQGWLQEKDSSEEVLLFTRPLDPDKLSSAGIVPPSNPSTTENGGATSPKLCFRGRIGRGGRIVFDRWNPILQTPITSDTSSLYVTPNFGSLPHDG